MTTFQSGMPPAGTPEYVNEIARFLRGQGYKIERLPDEWDWWSLTAPANAWRKSRNRCALATIVQIANAEGWRQKVGFPAQ